MIGRLSLMNVVSEGVRSDSAFQVVGTLWRASIHTQAFTQVPDTSGTQVIQLEYRTHNLWHRLWSTLRIILPALRSRTRVARHSEDGWHLNRVEVWHQRRQEQLRVGGIAPRVGDPL